MAAIVGYASSFAVVVAGLRAMGASAQQASSALAAMVFGVGAISVLISHWTRIPVLFAWSTPGAALLVSTGMVAGGWPAAVGAFMVCGALIVLAGTWPRLGALIAAIPVPVAQAMLAGVLLPLCIAPVLALGSVPWLVLPVIVTWLVGLRWFRTWAAPAAFAMTLAVIAVELTGTSPVIPIAPTLAFTVPVFTWQAMIGIALPLFIVTMASQNVPGIAVLESFGYRAPWRISMTASGAATIATASAGGHAINLAAITAAMVASSEAESDPERRWIAANAAGWTYLVLGLASTAIGAIIDLAPAGLVEAAAGLALVPTLAAALGTALGSGQGPALRREPAIVTFVIAAAGIGFLGIGPAFWAITAGVLVHLLLRTRVS